MPGHVYNRSRIHPGASVAQFMAQAVGTPRLIRHEHAASTCRDVGNHRAGWMALRPLYQMIVRERPDLLD